MPRPEYTAEDAERRLEIARKAFGFVPPVNQVLSERPDLFVPNFDLGDAVMGRGKLDPKTRSLIATACAAALSGEYCLKVQMMHAREAGADADEVLEALEIASYMCMTRSQSYSFREFAEQFGRKIEEPREVRDRCGNPTSGTFPGTELAILKSSGMFFIRPQG